MTDFTYFVSGRVYARVYGAAAGFEWPGLVDTLSLAITPNVIQLPDRTQPGGGVYKEIRRIESVACTINHRELDKSTLARALYGASADVVGAEVADEEHAAYLGSFIPLDKPGPYTLVSITDDATAPGTIDPENYEVRPGGIWINADAPDIVDSDVIKVTYTHRGYSRVQGLTQSPPELELFFDGVNEARGDTGTTCRLHRVRFGPTEALELLSGDDFGALGLTGEVLKDLTKTGAGVSQYLYCDLVDEAA